ncbi:MAG: hypothetical protein ABSF56_00480 [Minisyncoccia bacterium]
MAKPDSQRGFMIIETLVAISVLMIAIAGPLVVASRGLFGAAASKDQLIASYLAQESLETAKNIRDINVYNINNGSTGIDWLTTGSSVTDLSLCTKASPCDISVIDSATVSSCSSSGCPIYLESNGYGHVNGSGAVATPFTRYVYLNTPGGSGNCSVSGVECTITAVIDWNEKTIPYEISMSSQLTDSAR